MAGRIFRALKAAPGLLLGLSVLLDMGATGYSRSRVPGGIDADMKAMASDWEKVGQDLYKGLALYEEEHGR